MESLKKLVMPSSDSQTLALLHPTASEINTQNHENASEWRGALALEPYLRRELFLSNLDLTRDGGITSWILVDTAEKVQPGGDRTVLAGCETIRKRALIVRDGQVRDAICHGVCSVFTPERFRGKGYAARMIRDLARQLETWQRVNNTPFFSVLFSDIGKKFYAKSGWNPKISSHVHLPPIDKSIATTHAPTTSVLTGTAIVMPPATTFTASAIPDLCAADEAYLRSKLSNLPSGTPTSIAIIPDAATMSWHHGREDFVANELFKKTPVLKGACAFIDASSTATTAPSLTTLTNGHPSATTTAPSATSSAPTNGHVASNGTTSQRRVWAIWTRFWYNSDITKTAGNTLHILRLHIDPKPDTAYEPPEADGTDSEIAAIAAVLREAQYQAREWGMREVELWNPCHKAVRAVELLLDEQISREGASNVIKDELKGMWGKIVHREKESICALKWYDAQGAPSDGDDIVWMESEKFCWC